MNKTDVEMLVNLRENTNEKSDQFGNFYPYLERTSTLDTRGFCKHVAKHNTIYGRDVIEGVATLFANCTVELLSMGIAVQMTGFGTFYPTLQSRPGGVASMKEAVALGADDIVQGVHVRFLPDSTNLDNITSKKFKEQCSLKLHMLEEVTVTEVDGKKVYKHTYTPISEKAKEAPTPPEP